jgi:hypothetical protein
LQSVCLAYEACLGRLDSAELEVVGKARSLSQVARATTIDAGDNVFHHYNLILHQGYTRPCDTTMWSHRREAAEAEDKQRASKRSRGRVSTQQLARLCRTAPRSRYWGVDTNEQITIGATLPVNNNVHLSTLLCKQEKSRHGAEQEESQESQEIFDR